MDKKIFYIKQRTGCNIIQQASTDSDRLCAESLRNEETEPLAGEKAVGSLQTILLQSIDREQRGVLVRTL